MATQKKFLAMTILISFILSAGFAADSHARDEALKPKKSSIKMSVSGTVSEIIKDDNEFDFLLIKGVDGDVWVATPKKEFTVGDLVSCDEGFVLEKYKIKTLKHRKFEKIIFTECKQ